MAILSLDFHIALDLIIRWVVNKIIINHAVEKPLSWLDWFAHKENSEYLSDVKHFGAIQWVEEDLTCVVTISMSHLLGSSTKISMPTIEAYLGIESSKDYWKLKAVNSNKFSVRNIIPLPPFLLQEINEKIIESKGDSTEVLLAVIQKVKECNTNLTENRDGEEREAASNSCHNIFHRLFLATKNKIKPTLTVGYSIKDDRDYFKNIQGGEGKIRKFP